LKPCKSYSRRFQAGDLVRIKKYCKIGGHCGIIVKANGMFLKALMQSGEIIDVISANCEAVSES
jgi:hypothetical protein